ncbi:MAG: hypothetical protein IJH53_01335 [Oscillospiraceae bacterium]|nr:hypothetical protein [Oscillospiraceae bacterium]
MIFSNPNRLYRFKGTDRKKVKDQAMSDDFRDAEQYGRVRLGNMYFYYRDLGVKYYVPYDYIDRAFTRISECPEDEFSNNQVYYRLILEHDGKEFANLIFNTEGPVEKIYERLAVIAPAIAIGFVKKQK